MKSSLKSRPILRLAGGLRLAACVLWIVVLIFSRSVGWTWSASVGPAFGPTLPNATDGDVSYTYVFVTDSGGGIRCRDFTEVSLEGNTHEDTIVNGVETYRGFWESYGYWEFVPCYLCSHRMYHWSSWANSPFGPYPPAQGYDVTVNCDNSVSFVDDGCYTDQIPYPCDNLVSDFYSSHDNAGNLLWSVTYTHPSGPCSYFEKIDCTCSDTVTVHPMITGSSTYYGLDVYIRHGATPPSIPRLGIPTQPLPGGGGTSVNPPTINVPGAISVAVGRTIPIYGISVTAPEGVTSLQMSLNCQEGVLTLHDTPSGLSVAGNGTAAVTLNGSVADLNTALNGLFYTAGNSVGTDVIIISAATPSGDSATAIVPVNITSSSNVMSLIDVDFGGGPAPSPEVGFAATGVTTNDFWNYYNESYWVGSGALANLKFVDGTSSSVGITVDNAPGSWGSGSTDSMYNDYIYPFNWGNVTVTLTNLPVGSYDLYLYSLQGKFHVTAGGVDYGTQRSFEARPVSNPPRWQRGLQYVLFQGVTVSAAGQSVVITVLNPDTAIAGLQVAPGKPPFGTRISGGLNHSLGVEPDRTVWAWGLNSYGQLGDGTTTPRTTPVQVTNLSGVMTVSAGAQFSLALKTNGTVWAWGLNIYGQLGSSNAYNSTTGVRTPLQVTGLPLPAIAVSGGRLYSSYAVLSDGTVWAWGYNAMGQLGDGSTQTRYIPRAVTNLFGIVSVAGGNRHALALKSDGTVWAWGDNTYGELGDGSYNNRYMPVQVTNLPNNIIAVSAGTFSSYALGNDGKIWAWGYNSYGSLGNGTTSQTNMPVQVMLPIGVFATGISAGGYHCLAQSSDNAVWAWGTNPYGQLGNGNNNTQLTPVSVSLSGQQTLGIAAGLNHSLAVKPDLTLLSWGLNASGQLGNGTTVNRNTPGPVSGF